MQLFTPQIQRPTRRHLRRAWGVALAAAATLLLAGVPAGASADQTESARLTFDQQFTGPTSAAGTWVSHGAIEDHGTRTETFSATPRRDGGFEVTGSVESYGQRGTFSISFAGTERFIGETRARAQVKFVFTGGTGAYAGIQGGGTAVADADLSALTLSGFAVAKVDLQPSG
jgi:hypothetical protein